MIPLRDVIPSRTTPYVTITLIVVNALVFFYQLSLGEAVEEFILYFGLIPAAFSWVAVFTSMFLHGGLLHFGGNMLYLWIFGDNVEDRMGHGRFLVFYLLCGTAAALAQTIVEPGLGRADGRRQRRDRGRHGRLLRALPAVAHRDAAARSSSSSRSSRSRRSSFSGSGS